VPAAPCQVWELITEQMAKAVRAADGKCWKYVGLYNYIDIDMRSPYIMIHIYIYEDYIYMI